MLRVDLLLSCNDIGVKEIESILQTPKAGDEFDCPLCKKKRTIIKVSSPYYNDHVPVKQSPNQKSLGE